MPRKSNPSVCAVIPTYNHGGTLFSVVERTCRYADTVIVVNDGSTDHTLSEMRRLEESFPNRVVTVSYPKNRGKGYAIKTAIRKAKELGFSFVVALDSDGQHNPDQIPLFLSEHQKHPDALLTGCRNMNNGNMPAKNKFANKFSNFWFRIQTGCNLKDTQNGFRLYPVDKMKGLGWMTNRYETDLEFLVFSAWANIEIIPVPVDVYYPEKGELISHFRPGVDFTRISILNTVLCLLAVVYGWPRMLWPKISRFFVSVFCLFIYLWETIVGSQVALFSSNKYSKVLHGLICRVCRFNINHIPFTTFTVDNPHGENFEKPALIIANHQSQLDLWAVLSLSPKIIFLTNQRIQRNFLYGYFIRKAGFLPVSIGLDDTLDKMKEMVEHGYSIAIFPEGTRSADGQRLRFHKGAFYLAEQTGLDIVPVFLYGMEKLLPKGTLMVRRGSMGMEIGRRVGAGDDSFGNGYRERTAAFYDLYKRKINPMEAS